MADGTYEFQSEFAKKHQAKGKAEAVFDVLEARGLRVSDEARARILACTDSLQLAAWERKAVTVASVDQLF